MSKPKPQIFGTTALFFKLTSHQTGTQLYHQLVQLSLILEWLRLSTLFAKIESSWMMTETQLTKSLNASLTMITVKLRIHAHLLMTTVLQTANMMELAISLTPKVYQLQVISSKTTGDTSLPLVPKTSLIQSKTLIRLCWILPTSLLTLQEFGLEV